MSIYFHNPLSSEHTYLLNHVYCIPVSYLFCKYTMFYYNKVFIVILIWAENHKKMSLSSFVLFIWKCIFKKLVPYKKKDKPYIKEFIHTLWLILSPFGIGRHLFFSFTLYFSWLIGSLSHSPLLSANTRLKSPIVKERFASSFDTSSITPRALRFY